MFVRLPFNPKATEEVDEMIKMIQNLIDKGHAYEKNGTVYFEPEALRNMESYQKEYR